VDSRIVSPEDALRIVTREESHFWEEKSILAKGAPVRETAAALANADGGEIAVGIEDRLSAYAGLDRWKGSPTIEELNYVHQVLVEPEPPVPYRLDYLLIDGEQSRGFVALVNVGKSPAVHRIGDQVWVRRGAQNVQIRGQQITNLALGKGAESYEDQLLAKFTGGDLASEEELQEFLHDYSPATAPDDYVVSQRLVDRDSGQATVASAVLYASSPSAVIPKKCSIKIARYATKEAEARREYLQGEPTTIELPARNAIDKALEIVTEMIQNLKILQPDGTLTAAKYPPEALKEIIVNAVIHRDYNISDDILITVFDNRVVVRSPGRLPGHITVDNILSERFARNSTIVRLIAKYPNPPNKDIGEGLNTALSKMAEAKLRKPEFIASDDAFTVELRHTPLARPEELVMEYLSAHESITNSIARELCGIRSENAMKEVFKSLQRAGRIQPVPGRTRGPGSAWQKVKP
jgi:ATP-dependent DNA helicase RecG